MHNPKLGSVGRTFICSVVFVDIVEYSKKTVSTQLAQKGWFNGMLSETLQGISDEDRIVIDSGDGAAICLLGDPEEAIFITNALRVALAEHAYPEFHLRMGINLGPVKMVKDINGRPNILGDGINDAQRVMSFAAPGQILVSRSYYDIVSRVSEEYERLFRYQGEHRDKHVRAHQVYEVVVHGAPQPPPAAAGDPDEPEPAQPAIDAAVVEALGARLTDHLGPIAPLLARRSARKARTVAELVAMLADGIPVPAQREQFLRQAGKAVPQSGGDKPAPAPAPAAAPAPAPARPEPALQIDAEALARLEKLLARHIGPMAAVLVKRAVKSARDRRGLLEALTASIDDDGERAQFEADAWGALGRS
jgi:class 3 adenylate cyclase